VILRLFAFVLLWCGFALKARTLEDLRKELRESQFAAGECYRVRELRFQRGEAKIWLNDGWLLFRQPVRGVITAAMFVAEEETSDGELLLLPPTRADRRSLAHYTRSTNLEDKFRNALMIFSDNTGAELMAELRRIEAKSNPDMGLLLAGKWNSVLSNLTNSLEQRLLQDLQDERRAELGLFYAVIGGTRLGTLDIILDGRATQPQIVGRLAQSPQGTIFETWLHFRPRRWRSESSELPFRLENYQISAEIAPDLSMGCITSVRVAPQRAGLLVLPLEINARMRIEKVLVNGEPAEFFQQASLRSRAARTDENEGFLVQLPRPTVARETLSLQIEHRGAVISTTPQRTHLVSARGTWYPQSSYGFSNYQLRYRYPRQYTLVSTGERRADSTDGDFRQTEFQTARPVRLAGFNLGEYEREAASRGSLQVELYYTRAMRETRTTVLAPPPVMPRQRTPGTVMATVIRDETSPEAWLHGMTKGMMDAFQYFQSIFGEPTQSTLVAAPVPGVFGQGFPGLLYLSTLAYADPQTLSPERRHAFQRNHFNEILIPHEVAHQWWGNLISFDEVDNEWLSEALTNYSALLFLEKQRGARLMDAVLEGYQSHLLSEVKLAGGESEALEGRGPLTWAPHLRQSEPEAWQGIIYEKGSWVMHMLRRRMGDEAFLRALRAMLAENKLVSLDSAHFREILLRHLPKDMDASALDAFLETWVQATGIPQMELRLPPVKSAAAARAGTSAVSGTILLRGAPEDAVYEVPLELRLANGKTQVRWVRVAGEENNFQFSMPARVTKVTLDPGRWLLRR
jgi:hypothetical protein